MPWMSQSALGLLTGELESRRGECEELRGELKNLTERMLEMKRQGFELTTPLAPPPEEMPVLPEAVIEEIERFAPRNTPLWHQLGRYAEKAMRNEGAQVDDVVEEIKKGGDLDVLI